MTRRVLVVLAVVSCYVNLVGVYAATTAAVVGTYAAANRTLSVSYASSPGFTPASSSFDVFPRPELLRDFQAGATLQCDVQPSIAASAQSKTTAKVLVAISKCLQDASISGIADWASAKLRGSDGGPKVIGQDTPLALTFALVNATCSSTTNSNSASTTRLNAFKKLGTIASSFADVTGTSGTGAATASTTFASVVAFVDSAGTYDKVDKYESSAGIALAFNFVVCEGTAAACMTSTARTAAATAYPNANYLAQLTLLAVTEVFPSIPRYSCDHTLPNGVPAFVSSGAGSASCTCVCPRGYVMVSGKVSSRCEASSTTTTTTSSGCCAWDSYGPFKLEVSEAVQECVFTNLTTSYGLPPPRIERRSRSSGASAGSVSVSCSGKRPTVYDSQQVATALAHHGTNGSTVRPLVIPAWASSSHAFGDPLSSAMPITAATRNASCTWTRFETAGSSQVDAVVLPGLGVYSLEVDADRIACRGCIAVTDHFRPRATTTCPSGYCDVESCDDGATAVLSVSSLQMARDAVAAFVAYPLNASNDACSVASRCDDQQIMTRSFYDTEAPTMTMTVDSATEFVTQAENCFSPELLWADLLQPPNYGGGGLFDDANILQQPVPSTVRTCSRCCSMSVLLRERWTDYQCDGDYAVSACEGLESEQCAFAQCLRVVPATLLTADAVVLPAVQRESERVRKELSISCCATSSHIHREIPCLAFDANDKACTFSSSLLELVSLEVAIADDFRDEYNAVGGAEAAPASNLVTWRVRVEGELSWRRVDSTQPLVFSQSETSLILEAWSMCGKVRETTVNVHLHLQAPPPVVEVCERFDSMWYQTSVLQPLVTDTLCNYPGSDFVELTFDFPGRDLKKRSHALPALPVAAITCFASFDGSESEAEMLRVSKLVADKATTTSVMRRFAVELRYQPATQFLTSVRVRCEFALTKSQPNQTCERSFILASCEGPCTGDRYAGCAYDACARNPLPGPFEACGGTIVRVNASGNATVTRGESKCCQSCNRKTVCVPLLDVPSGQEDIKRCEPQRRTITKTHRGHSAPTKAATSAYGIATQLEGSQHRTSRLENAFASDAVSITAVFVFAVAGLVTASIGLVSMYRRNTPSQRQDGGSDGGSNGGSYALMRD